MMHRGQEAVPSGPFAEWLNQRYAHYAHLGQDGTVKLCLDIGWPPDGSGARRLYRHRHQLSESSTGKSRKLGRKGARKVSHCELFSRAVVEDALFNAGVEFGDVYPEIAASEDIMLEPSAWCPGCREERSPINGVCAFCEWRIGPETGQVLRGRRLGVAA